MIRLFARLRKSESPPGRCVDCVHFRNDPASLEAAFPGISAMSSARADVRACDGLCARHGVYLGFSDGCAQFEPRRPPVP